MRKNNYIWLVGHFVRKVIHLHIYEVNGYQGYVLEYEKENEDHTINGMYVDYVNNDNQWYELIKRKIDLQSIRDAFYPQQKTFLDYVNEKVMKWKIDRLDLSIKW